MSITIKPGTQPGILRVVVHCRDDSDSVTDLTQPSAPADMHPGSGNKTKLIADLKKRYRDAVCPHISNWQKEISIDDARNWARTHPGVTA